MLKSICVHSRRGDGMFHIVVCDDDRTTAKHLQNLLERKFKNKIECKCLYSATELKDWVEGQKVQPNIIILDIALGDEDGIAIAKQMRSDYPQIKVILLSGFAQLASNVFDADPVYFLSKPIDEEKLFASVEKAMEIVETQQVKTITVAGTGGKIHRIKVEEIIYIETCNRNCKIHLDKGDCIEVMSKLSALMAEMPDYMIIIHQSFACNMYKIKSFSKEDGITVSDGTCIPVSRRHYKAVKEKIALHI